MTLAIRAAAFAVSVFLGGAAAAETYAAISYNKHNGLYGYGQVDTAPATRPRNALHRNAARAARQLCGRAMPAQRSPRKQSVPTEPVGIRIRNRPDQTAMNVCSDMRTTAPS